MIPTDELAVIIEPERFERLTRGGDQRLADDLLDLLTKMWAHGYERGLRSGAELLARAVEKKAR